MNAGDDLGVISDRKLFATDNVAIASPYTDKVHKMDNVERKHIDEIVGIWESYYDANRDYFLGFMNR